MSDDSSEVRSRSLKRSFAAVIPARIFRRLRQNPARGRKVLLRTIGIAVAVTSLVTVVLAVLALTFVAGTADKLAAVGDVLVGATLLLAAIAVNPGTGPPALLIELLADGYRKVIIFLVNFTVDGQPKFRVEGWGTDPEWK